MVPRWQKVAGEIYGRGPLLNALSAIKTTNLTIELILENANDGFVLFGLGGDQLYRHRSNNVYPLHLINDLFEQVCINKNIIKINPLMSRRLYQSYLNVKEKHRLTHCWQTQYMHEMKYPYSVDKYS